MITSSLSSGRGLLVRSRRERYLVRYDDVGVVWLWSAWSNRDASNLRPVPFSDVSCVCGVCVCIAPCCIWQDQTRQWYIYIYMWKCNTCALKRACILLCVLCVRCVCTVCVLCVCVCVNTDVGLTFSLGQFTEETAKELLFLVLLADLYQNNANSSVHTQETTLK